MKKNNILKDKCPIRQERLEALVKDLITIMAKSKSNSTTDEPINSSSEDNICFITIIKAKRKLHS